MKERLKGMSIDREKQYKRQNEHIKQNYDRHNLTMPKGKKDQIRKAAAAAGQSVNEFINNAIDAAILAAGQQSQDPDPDK